MRSASFRPVIALSLVMTLTCATAPAFAVPAAATLTGTVYGTDVKTPLTGATVVVLDASGVKSASRPTGADGAFAIPSLSPGRSALTIETKDGSFAVATPVTLAPGATLGVRLALKADGDPPDEDEDRKGGGAGWPSGALGAMSAVLIGFAAAGLLSYDNADDTDPVSPSAPASE